MEKLGTVMTDDDINQLVATAADVAHFFVGTPESEMFAGLHELRARMEAHLGEMVSREIAALIAESFVATVIRHRREIEAAGAVPVLN